MSFLPPGGVLSEEMWHPWNQQLQQPFPSSSSAASAGKLSAGPSAPCALHYEPALFSMIRARFLQSTFKTQTSRYSVWPGKVLLWLVHKRVIRRRCMGGRTDEPLAEKVDHSSWGALLRCDRPRMTHYGRLRNSSFPTIALRGPSSSSLQNVRAFSSMVSDGSLTIHI